MDKSKLDVVSSRNDSTKIGKSLAVGFFFHAVRLVPMGVATNRTRVLMWWPVLPGAVPTACTRVVVVGTDRCWSTRPIATWRPLIGLHFQFEFRYSHLN
jgi:hypothetical protein